MADSTEPITPDMPVDRVRRLLCGAAGHTVPRGWRGFPNVQEAYRQSMAAAVKTMPPYPTGKYGGRGIVTLGGGKYFASVYVTLRMIRYVGCDWPVEVWYLGRKRELVDWQQKILADLGATCIDADALAARKPVRILHGWELKVLAVLYSRFKQILFLDADSYPCRNPDFLFKDAGFKKHGAMFFPDGHWMKLAPSTWEVLGIEFRDERTFESGQFLLEKHACWRALLLTHWMNQRSDYYYYIGPRKSGQVGSSTGRGVHGDKDTFHLAWRYLGQDYAMPEKDYDWVPPAVVQHAPDGQPVFIHRARRKFHLGDGNFRTSRQIGPEFEPKLPMENEAHRFLAELRQMMP
jgi:hypothetical protein